MQIFCYFCIMLRNYSYIILLLTVILSVNCSKSGNSSPTVSSVNGSDTATRIANQILQTDSFVSTAQSKSGLIDVYIDYPMGGPEKAVSSIREFIKSTLFEENVSSVSDDPSAIVEEYCRQRSTALQNTLEQMGLTKVSRNEVPEEGTEIKMLFATEKYATYEVYRYSYLTNGAHGEYSDYGVTFRLSDGRRLGNIIRKVDEELYSHILQGMKRYFKVSSDRELASICTVDLSLMPMPTFPAYLTKEGVCLHYSIYDICPFEYGDPKVTIPYEVCLPYLTEEARELVK